MTHGHTEHSDDEILAAIDECIAADKCDPLEGGVAAGTLADHIGISDSNAAKRMADLALQGKLERVWGISPETHSARPSYLPPDHPHLKPTYDRDAESNTNG